ncbi:MAG: acetylxylan esterase [Bacteroidales bacterium]|nr:acetylxylan esterase [Bacteroidales bacterium]
MKMHFTKSTMLLLLCSFLTTVLSAQPAQKLISVIVSPDHDDWIYTTKDEVTFNVQVLKNENLLKNVTIDYEMGPDMLPDVKKQGVLLKDGKITLKGKMKQPGIYRLRVWANYDGNRYEGMGSAAFDPEKIQPIVKYPNDFKEFWDQTMEYARKTPLNPILTLMPERCTSKANVYHVSYESGFNGSRMYGILCVPKAPGKYPALLKVPGAGIRPYGGDIENAENGIITLEVGIHGIPVNMDPEIYNILGRSLAYGYQRENLNNKNEHYFRRVYAGCARGVDFLFELPEFDGTNLAVTGGSQGGALSIITASLEPRIKYLAAFYPALCDHEAYANGRAGGWPHYFIDNKPQANELETLRYYDVVNFARNLKSKGWYSFGYNDMVCPPTATYGAYNVIPAEKEIHLYQETGHWTYPEQWKKSNDWLRKQLGK